MLWISARLTLLGGELIVFILIIQLRIIISPLMDNVLTVKSFKCYIIGVS